MCISVTPPSQLEHVGQSRAGVGYFPSPTRKTRGNQSSMFLNIEGYSQLELDIFLSPSQFGSDKTLVGQPLDKQFLLRADFGKRTGWSGMFQNHCFSLPTAKSMRSFFSSFLCENVVQPQEVKFTRTWGLPDD